MVRPLAYARGYEKGDLSPIAQRFPDAPAHSAPSGVTTQQSPDCTRSPETSRWPDEGAPDRCGDARNALSRFGGRATGGALTGGGGAFVTGATVAHLCGLAAARHAVLKRVGWNVEANGLFGAPPITVLVGAEAHPSVTKSLGVLGLGRSRVVKVPVDGQGRMRADALPAMQGPTIACVQAGNVNTGAFDPIDEIGRRARAAGAWLHVDGAFGLWAATTSTHAAWKCGPRCERWDAAGWPR